MNQVCLNKLACFVENLYHLFSQTANWKSRSYHKGLLLAPPSTVTIATLHLGTLTENRLAMDSNGGKVKGLTWTKQEEEMSHHREKVYVS